MPYGEFREEGRKNSMETSDSPERGSGDAEDFGGT